MSVTFVGLPQAENEYPSCDGVPMADNTLHWDWLVTIKLNLDLLFLRDIRVFVAGDLLWYPVEGAPSIRIAPDVLVAFGRPKGHRMSYLQWVEGGISPQVVFEIFSPENRDIAMPEKFEFYNKYQAFEYYAYIPHSNELFGWLRRDGRLQPITVMRNWTSPHLGVRFEWTDEALNLIGPDGRRFVTYLEAIEELRL